MSLRSPPLAAASPRLTQMLTLLQVLLARHKETTKYYAIKVLQKKIIMKKKEVSVSLAAAAAVGRVL